MSIRFDVEVSLAFGADLTANPSTWSWTDITSYVLVREGGVTIRRGRADWQSNPQPSTCDVLVNNADGRFSRLNPTGAYYGQLAKNTPLRVRARATGGSYSTRFVGYVSEFPVSWDPSEAHFWVPLHADGVLRRLGLGSKPIRSISRLVGDYWQTYYYPGFPTIIPEPIGYWPLEDSDGATQASSGLIGGGDPLAVVAGTVTFGGDSPAPGAAAAPSIASASLRATVKTPVKGINQTDPMWHVSCYFRATADARILTWDFGSGATALALSGGDLHLISSTGGIQAFTGGTTVYTDGEWHFVTVDGFYSSATASLLLGTADDGTETCFFTPTVSPGPIRIIQANPLAEAGLASISHIMVGGPGTSNLPLTYTNMLGNAGDTTFETFRNLCVYHGLAYDTNPAESLVFLNPDLDGVPMGTFPTGSMRQVLDVIAAAESGLITERKTGEIGLDLRTGRENLSVTMMLDYNASHIKPPFEPSDDDNLTRNDVTVNRADGGAGQQVAVTTGPMGVDTIGRYDEQLSLSLYAQSQTYHSAGWRVNLGTVNEYRYPTAHLMFHSSSSLLTSWLNADIGSRITISNLPNKLTYDTADQILEGYTERINRYEWDVSLNLSPYKPYKLFEVSNTTADAGAFVGRLAGDDDAAIRTAITNSATSIDFDPNRYRWTTTADDFNPNLDVRLGGEVISVSNISTTAGTFVAVGAASHADNAAVNPAIYAGSAANDLLCVLAAIRSSGTGTLVTPTGYTRLPVFASTDNVQLYAKVHSGSESAPTITPSGGAAGDTVSAFTFGLRGTPCSLTSLANVVVNSDNLLNASAANIAYPGIYPDVDGCIVLLLGWKQDAFTSVAVPSGFTEDLEAPTAVGSDQSLYLAHRIQTGRTLYAGGSLAVTGGINAISRGAMVALAAGYQTFTVSARSTNGVTKAHSAGTKVEVEKAYVLGL